MECTGRVWNRQKGTQSMRRTNINAVLRMTKDYLDGKMDRIDYELDFPYEVTQRYQKMFREDAEYTDMLYYYLIERGTDRAAGLSDDDFHDLIQKQYLEVLDGVY